MQTDTGNTTKCSALRRCQNMKCINYNRTFGVQLWKKYIKCKCRYRYKRTRKQAHTNHCVDELQIVSLCAQRAGK